MAKKNKNNLQESKPDVELKRILDQKEREQLLFNAELLLPKKSFDKDLEIYQLQSGVQFSNKSLQDLIKSIASEYEPMFPNSKPFFKLMYKLCKWDKLDPNKFIKPPVVAIYIKKYIYARFKGDVLANLLVIDNPLVSGYIKKYKLFQFLTPQGLFLLEGYIQDAIDVMKTCTTWYEFELKYTKLYDLPVQLKLIKD